MSMCKQVQLASIGSGNGDGLTTRGSNNYTGDMRIASRPGASGGRRLSLAFAGLFDDGLRVKGSANSSWGKYVIGHAQNFFPIPSGAALRSLCLVEAFP